MVTAYAIGTIKTTTPPFVKAQVQPSASTPDYWAFHDALDVDYQVTVGKTFRIGQITLVSGNANTLTVGYADDADAGTNFVPLFDKDLQTTTLTTWEYYAEVPATKFLVMKIQNTGHTCLCLIVGVEE